MLGLRRDLRGLAISFTLVATVGVTADEALYAKARDLLAKRRGAEAYEVLKPAVATKAGDPEFDLLYGMSAIDAGKPTEATFALERVLDVQPDNAAAQAELGRAYYEMGENDAAKAQFEQVRGEKLPPTVQQNVDRYLAAIDVRNEARRTTYRAYVEVGAGYDSNVNSATDQTQIIVPLISPVIPATLGDSALEQDSAIWSIDTGFGFNSPLAEPWTLYGGVNLQHRAAMSETVCNTPEGETSCSTAAADGTLGVAYALSDQDRLRGSAYGQKFIVGSEENRDLAAFNFDYTHTHGKSDQMSLFSQMAMIRYPDQSLRDVNRYVGGAGWVHAFSGSGTPVVYASGYGGTEVNLNDNDDPVRPALGVGRNLAGVRVGGEYSFTSRARAFGSVIYEGSWYDSASPGFFLAGTDPTDCDEVDCREDDYVSVNGGVRYSVTRMISIRPEVRYTSNDSNVVLNDYDRWEAMVFFRSAF